MKLKANGSLLQTAGSDETLGKQQNFWWDCTDTVSRLKPFAVCIMSEGPFFHDAAHMLTKMSMWESCQLLEEYLALDIN